MSGYFGGARGAKRKLPDNLNLVPFIDLFSMLIIFLLMTAVWDQLATVQANLGDQSGGKSVEIPKDVKKVKQNTKVTITSTYIELFDEGKTAKLPIEGEIFNVAPLTEFMTTMRAKYEEKTDMVIIATDDAKYRDVVIVMDESIGQNFKDIVLTGMAGK